MCDFGEVQKMTLSGSGRANGNWFKLRDAQVYHDHLEAEQIVNNVLKAAGLPKVVETSAMRRAHHPDLANPPQRAYHIARR